MNDTPTKQHTAATVAVLAHGPADTAITLGAWSLESNPLVTALGPERWVGIKLLGLAGFLAAYRLSAGHRVAQTLTAALAVLGVVVVATNLAYLGL